MEAAEKNLDLETTPTIRAEELVRNLGNSAVVRSEISYSMQLGFPMLKKLDGELCICFKPHREDYKNGKISYYPVQYEIAWVYPFEHVVLFKNLKYTNGCSAEKPLQETDMARVLKDGRHYIQNLYDACTKVLNVRGKNGNITDSILRDYQKTFEETVCHMGLEELYLTK